MISKFRNVLSLLAAVGPVAFAQTGPSTADYPDPATVQSPQLKAAPFDDVVDKFTGRSRVSRVALTLPGNVGFDLQIRRAWQIKQYSVRGPSLCAIDPILFCFAPNLSVTKAMPDGGMRSFSFFSAGM